jgi:hypothetical protein
MDANTTSNKPVFVFKSPYSVKQYDFERAIRDELAERGFHSLRSLKGSYAA